MGHREEHLNGILILIILLLLLLLLGLFRAFLEGKSQVFLLLGRSKEIGFKANRNLADATVHARKRAGFRHLEAVNTALESEGRAHGKLWFVIGCCVSLLVFMRERESACLVYGPMSN